MIGVLPFKAGMSRENEPESQVRFLGFFIPCDITLLGRWSIDWGGAFGRAGFVRLGGDRQVFSEWKKKSAEPGTLEILAPVTGEAVALAEVPDEAFAAGHMGKGIAIEPAEGKLIAPFAGEVVHVIKSRHAVMLEHAEGIQFLFHIGINTVSLKGEGFTSHVSVGDKVEAGQLLIEFNIEQIRAAGYPAITPIVVTNADEMVSSLEMYAGPVTAGRDVIFKAVLKSG